MGFVEPNFDIIRPDAGPNTSNTSAKGNSTFVALIAFSPNPRGAGLSTNMGIV